MADLSAAALRERFDGVTDHTVGVEEELMLLDPETLDLLPAAARVHSELGGRVSLRTELPAAQVETASPVCDSIEAAAWALNDGRRELGAGVEGWARLAGSGTHPFAAPEGALRDDPKYDELKAAFPWALPRQLVFGLHIHVAVRGADRALAVLNAVRSYLPDLAALAGNAPLHAGRDTGLASVRPEISGLLPRQGVPPAFSSWEAYADYLAWGRRGGLFPGEGEPWWEARGHDELGTIELRVPDAQTTADEAAGVLALGAGPDRVAGRALRRRRAAAGARHDPHRREPLARAPPRPGRRAARPRQRRAAAGARPRARADRARRARRGAPRRRGGARSRAHIGRPQRRRAPARARRRAGPPRSRRIAR